jgi:hypothetical protein
MVWYGGVRSASLVVLASQERPRRLGAVISFSDSAIQASPGQRGTAGLTLGGLKKRELADRRECDDWASAPVLRINYSGEQLRVLPDVGFAISCGVEANEVPAHDIKDLQGVALDKREEEERGEERRGERSYRKWAREEISVEGFHNDLSGEDDIFLN